MRKIKQQDLKPLADHGEDTPMGRPGQSVEVAPAYVFLASDAASYTSGATIAVIDGKITI